MLEILLQQRAKSVLRLIMPRPVCTSSTLAAARKSLVKKSSMRIQHDSAVKDENSQCTSVLAAQIQYGRIPGEADNSLGIGAQEVVGAASAARLCRNLQRCLSLQIPGKDDTGSGIGA